MLEAIQFDSFSEFLDMGGYAFNVWSVYILFVVFVVVNLLVPMYRKRQIIRELKRRAIVSEEAAKRLRQSAGLESDDIDGELL